MSFLAWFPGWYFQFFSKDLSSDSLFSNKSLNFWSFIKSLISFFDFSSDNILCNIVLFSQSKGLSDMTGSLWSKSSWSFSISESCYFWWTFLNNFKSNNCKIWATDASSDWLSFSFSSSSWSVQSCSYIINNLIKL